MPIPFPPAKERTLNRARALGELVLPCLALAVVVLSSGFMHARPAPAASKTTEGSPTRHDGWLFANTASSSDATIEISRRREGLPGKAGKNLTATTVTTYTVYPTY